MDNQVVSSNVKAARRCVPSIPDGKWYVTPLSSLSHTDIICDKIAKEIEDSRRRIFSAVTMQQRRIISAVTMQHNKFPDPFPLAANGDELRGPRMFQNGILQKVGKSLFFIAMSRYEDAIPEIRDFIQRVNAWVNEKNDLPVVFEASFVSHNSGPRYNIETGRWTEDEIECGNLSLSGKMRLANGNIILISTSLLRFPGLTIINSHPWVMTIHNSVYLVEFSPINTTTMVVGVGVSDDDNYIV